MSQLFKLIILQLRYTWQAWIGALVVFIAAGIVLGVTMIGAISTISVHLGHGNYNPVAFFATPAIFGLITLMLILTGITRLLITKFKTDYNLWAILGANPNQLALLIGGQMSLSGMIGGFLGYFLALPIVRIYYAWVISTPGMREFPAIKMKLQLSSLTLTVLILGAFIGITGIINAKKVFSDGHKIHRLTKKRSCNLSILGWLWCVMVVGCLAYVYLLFFQGSTRLAALFGGHSLVETYSQALLALIFLMIMTINAAETVILPGLVKLLTLVFPTTLIKTFKTAYWNVLDKKDFLKTVAVPLVIFSLIASFFMYMIFDLANVASKRNLAEIVGTLSLFLGAPFLIILANTISLTIISSSERTTSIRQLQLIGFSLKDLMTEKRIEAEIYGLIVFIQATIGNALLFVPILKAADKTHTYMFDSWWSIFEWPAVTGTLVFLFILIVDDSYSYKIYSQNRFNVTQK